MKKIKTIEAVNAYVTLKSLKTSSMSDETMIAVWRDMKALRTISETYEKDKEEAKNSLHDDEYEKMTSKAQGLGDKQERERKNEYTFTEQDFDEIKEVNKYFEGINAKTQKYFSELDNKEVEVEIVEIAEMEIVKSIKSTDLSLSELEKLECVCKG